MGSLAAPRQERLGAWKDTQGTAFAEILPGGTPGDRSFFLFSSVPSSDKAVPLCLAYDVKPDVDAFDCHVPLKDCVAKVSLTSKDKLLVLAPQGAARGSECAQTGIPSLSLSRVDMDEAAIPSFVEHMKEMQRESTPYFDQLGAEPEKMARELIRLGRETGYASSAVGTDFKSLERSRTLLWFTWSLVLRDCGGAPGSEKCPEKLARQVLRKAATPRKRRAASIRTADKMPARRVPDPARKDPAGLWIGEQSKSGNPGFAQFSRLDNGRLQLEFLHRLPPERDLPAYRCVVGVTEPVQGILRCDRCGKRVKIETHDDGLRVKVLSAAHNQDSNCEPDVNPRRDRYLYELRRVDPFDLVLEPYLKAVEKSDFGSAGGNFLYAVLGMNPEKAMHRIISGSREAYIASGKDPWSLSYEDAITLVGTAQGTLMHACEGMLPGAEHGKPKELPKACPKTTVEAAFKEAVERFKQVAPY